MSDFGGIIGGVVGAVVGGVVGGPAGATWGWSIGATVGGVYSASQQVIPGPKIGDVQRQTSQEGGFRAIVYGRSHPISGNVIADGGPVIVKKKESQGKGGPKVETESAYRTYAVGFCEGETSLLQAWRNGTLVYDSEDSSMAAENAKFFEYARWYSGSFDQTADPDLEGIYGVGNAPFFRGTSYLVLAHEDVTDQRGAWSQWQVRVFRGAATSYTTPPYSVYVVDSFNAYSRAADGRVIEMPLDELSTSSHALDGQLRDVVHAYQNYRAESLNTGSYALDGTLRTILVSYENYPQESVNTGSYALNGTIRVSLIAYPNYQPESLDASSHALDGTLT